MSSSFVPKIAMSKGTARDNKFDVSVHCHTTSEVGYLQPTFSKILAPNSSLKIKTSDSILMSSLVCPTFGDLALRSWYMATPVSSLWACLGAFLSQRAFNDLDSESGHSIPSQMPRSSMASIIHNMIWSQYRQYVHSNNDLVASVPVPSMLAGNLTYAFAPSGTRASNSLIGISDLYDLLLKYNGSYNREPIDNLVELSSNSFYPILYDSDNSIYTLGITRAGVTDNGDLYRFSTMFPWWWNGLVIQNSDDIKRMLTDKDGKTDFPSASDCPYVVVMLHNVGYNCYRSSQYETAPEGVSTDTGGIYFYPLTLRMFQGDTDFNLYSLGWRNDVKANGGKLYHSNGKSLGWSLQTDDAYFTGELPHPDKFDIAGIQPDRTHSVSNGHLSFFWAVRLSRRFKRIRKLFVGFGGQFNPFDKEPQTFWKLMSYYKSWFDNFYPKRDVQYYQTPLARVVNYFSYHSRVFSDTAIENLVSGVLIDGPALVSNVESVYFDFFDMIYACGDAKYLMPIDYFTLADKNPLEENYTSDENMDVVVGTDDPSAQLPESNVSSGSFSGLEYTGSNLNGWAVKMADKMLSYLTKKRVVGKSVSDSMRAIFGAVDEHDKAHESTWCFGTHSTPINISAVMSQAETEEMHLGDYAGRGIGGDESKTFDVSVKSDVLVVIVMTAVVPRLGYYQGTLKENRIGLSPNDFCKPLWDAVGYDDVDVSEYIADVVHKTDVRNVDALPELRGMETFNGRILGLVPRYTWYKTSRDILNGDMSLPSLKDSMNPYVLTRDVARNFSTDPLAMRTIAPDSFNKIFNESSSLDDHFIIQLGHKCDLYAPLKSITTSFDDFDVNEDGTIEVEHS